MNVHTPERMPGESREAYVSRRQRSRDLVRQMRCHGMHGGQNSREALRDEQRANRKLRGTYSLGLLQPQRRRNQDSRKGPRDSHGAVTFVGREVEFVNHNPGAGWHETGGGTSPEGFVITARRIWLAGISAQRGY